MPTAAKVGDVASTAMPVVCFFGGFGQLAFLKHLLLLLLLLFELNLFLDLKEES